MDFKDSEDYKRYASRNGRPDDKLPPLDYQVCGHFRVSVLRTKLINTGWIPTPRPRRDLLPMARGHQRSSLRGCKLSPCTKVFDPRLIRLE
jgi:hypothetical protein